MTWFGLRLGRYLHILLTVTFWLLCAASVAAIVVVVMAYVAPDQWPDGDRVTFAGGNGTWPATPWARGTVAVILLAQLTAWAIVVRALLGLMRSVADGQPFVAENVRRLYLIAGLFVAIMLAKLIVPPILPVMARLLLGTGTGWLDMASLLMSLVILVLAEVFRGGVRLREEAEGTI